MARPDGHKEISAYLVETIRHEHITTMHFLFHRCCKYFVDHAVCAAKCTGLKRVVCSGEALSAYARAVFFKSGYRAPPYYITCMVLRKRR